MREHAIDNHVSKKVSLSRVKPLQAISPTAHIPYNQETQAAIEDVLQGRNLRGPFHSVEALFEDLDADD